MTRVRLLQTEMAIITGPVDTHLESVRGQWWEGLKGLLLSKGIAPEELSKPCRATELWPSGDLVLEFGEPDEVAKPDEDLAMAQGLMGI